MSTVLTVPLTNAALVLSQQPGSDNGGQGEDFGKSSPVGFLLLLIFLIAVAFLVRSMTKHLKRIPASFDTEEGSGSGKSARDDSAEAPETPESTAKPEAEPSEAEKSERSS
ncbi:hypothetical protein [Amycolatopsis pigmentata]|uniref:Preprotein translocase subunit SecG n=1 Tax=Amycolatopsis pigmentata TaxID=450801 RepID=A0ABW5FX38_9PSEU